MFNQKRSLEKAPLPFLGNDAQNGCYFVLNKELKNTGL